MRLLSLVAAISMASALFGLDDRSTISLLGDLESTTSSAATAGCFGDDPLGPSISSSVISKTTPYYGGYIREASAYYVYANVTGAATRVTADIRTLTAGEYLAPLAAGAYSVGGVAYGYRSAAFFAAAPLAEGPYAYSVSAADASDRCRTAGSSVTVDDTAAYGTDVQPIQGGGLPGRPATGDLVTFTFSEVVDPESILAGWSGASTGVVVRITESATNDVLTIWNATNTIQLPLGSTALGGNYVSANSSWGASGTASTMVQSGTAITVTFGTEAGATLRVNANAAAVWTPSAAPTDRAGNASGTTPVTEGGAADRNF